LLIDVVLENNSTYKPHYYNELWKKLIEEMFEEFIVFFAPNLQEVIDFTKPPVFLQHSELEPIFSKDNLQTATVHILKAPLRNQTEKWLFIHIPNRGMSLDDFRKSMFQYFYSVFDHFNQEVYGIALLTNRNTHPRQNYYSYHYYGTSLTYTYHVVNFLELNENRLQKSSNPFTIVVLAELFNNKTKLHDKRRYSIKRDLIISVYQRFTAGKSGVKSMLLLHFIDHLLIIPKAYQETLEKELIHYRK
jgi:hypothetical protein